MLHELVAGWLGVALGEYHHHVDSLHLYEQHWDTARHVSNPAREADEQTGSVAGACSPMPSLRLPWPELGPLLDALATDVLATDAMPATLPPHDGQQDPGDGWAQIAAVMTSYRKWKHGDRDTARALIHSEPGVLTDALHRWYTHLVPPAASAAAAPVGVVVASTGPAAEGVA